MLETRHLFDGNDPYWSSQTSEGDLLVSVNVIPTFDIDINDEIEAVDSIGRCLKVPTFI